MSNLKTEKVEQVDSVAKTKKEKRYRNFTFKIDIDYIIRGGDLSAYGLDINKIDLSNMDIVRQLVYTTIMQNFQKFCEKYGVQAFANLHNLDYHEDENGDIKYDDWHIHFVFCGENPATETNWRKRLAKFGLKLTDQTRIEKGQHGDWDHMDMPNLPHAVAYLIHRTLKSISEHKYAYDERLIFRYNCTQIQLDDLLQKAVENESSKIAKNALKLDDDVMLPVVDDFIQRIWKNGAMLSQLRLSAEKIFGNLYGQFWVKYKDKFKSEIRDYSVDLYKKMVYMDRDFKLFYITGASGVGKSTVANASAYYFADRRDLAVHIGAVNGKRKTFDITSTYNNELVTVAHEFKSNSMGADEFEAFADPHIYPTLNSRNFDKPYFAQACFIPNAENLCDWVYENIYDDYCGYGKTTQHYGWITEIQHNTYVDKLSFPSSFANFIKYFEVESLRKKVFEHWNWQGISKFFEDWWQVLRRFSYLFELENSEENGVVIVVSKLKNDSMRPLRNPEDILYNISMLNHFEPINRYYCTNYLDSKILNATLRQIFTDLERRGLTIRQELPKLQTNEDIFKKNGDDGKSVISKMSKNDDDNFEVRDSQMAEAVEKIRKTALLEKLKQKRRN